MSDTDTPNGCHTCGAPTGDTANLCRTHTTALTADLRTIRGLLPELEVTITRQDKLLHFNDRKSSAETPLNWNENASQVRWELEATVNAWCLDVSRLGEDERDPLQPIQPGDVPALADWLVRNIATLRTHAEAGKAADELGNAIRRVTRAIDHPAIRARFYVGPCPEQVGEGCCDGEVWSFLASSDDELSYMRCTACEHRWDSHQWLRVGPRILARKQQLGNAA